MQMLSATTSGEDLKEVMDAQLHALDELGILQHHDAITGTCSTLVMNDYLNRLNTARLNLHTMTSNLVSTYAEHKLGLNLTEVDFEDMLPHETHFLIENKYSEKEEFLVFIINPIGN